MTISPRFIFLSSMFLPLLSYAADLEEIVVTAQKSPEIVKAEAVSQTSLSQTWIDDLYVDTFEEFSFFVPGLYVEEQGINSVGYAIRGMTTNNPEATRTPRVTVWMHGMDISRSQGAYTALFDLDRVDVLKGPVGSLFARGGQIGGINLENHFAELNTDGAIYSQFGNWNEVKINGFYNQKLSDNSALRIALFSHQRDGYIKNSNGTDLHSVDTQAGRLSFMQMLGTTRIDIQANLEKDDPSGLAFQNFLYPPSKPYEESDINNARQLHIKRNIKDIFARVSHPFSDSFKSEASVMYRGVKSNDVFDPDGTKLNLIQAEEYADYNTLEEVIKFQYTGDNYTSTFGMGHFHENVAVTFAAHINEQLAIKLKTVQDLVAQMMDPNNPPDLTSLIGNDLFDVNGNPNPYTGFDLSTNRYEQQTESVNNDSFSLFFDNTWYMNTYLALSFGLRYSQESLHTEIFTPPFSDGGQTTITDVYGNLFLQPAFPSLPGSAAEETTHGFSGRLSLNYYMTENMTMYATYARGRRPDILNYTEQSQLEHLSDEIVDSYEAGFNLNIPDSFSKFDASLYYYNFRHFATQLSGIGALQVISDDSASANVKGLELGYTQLFPYDILLFSNLTWNDAFFNKSAIIQGTNRFRYAPEWSGAVSLSKDFKMTNDWKSRLTWQESFQSEVFFEDDNSSNYGRNRQGGYGLMNIYLDFVFMDKLTLNAYIKNAADKRYIIDAGNFGQLFGLPTFVPAIGRQYGIGVNYQFK